MCGPSLRFDARAVTGVLAPFLGPGFYYKTFMRPRVLWPWYQRVLRMFSAGGKVIAGPNEAIYEKRYTHPDVLVAGAGPAGMAAAIGAAEYGAKVVLVEEEHQTGGHLRWGGPHALEALAGAAVPIAQLRYRGAHRLGRFWQVRPQLDRGRATNASRRRGASHQGESRGARCSARLDRAPFRLRGKRLARCHVVRWCDAAVESLRRTAWSQGRCSVRQRERR